MKNLLKFKRADTDFLSHQRAWGNFEQENNSIALNVLFVSHNNEETKLAYRSSYNKHKNQVILLMITDEANNYCYFAIKNLSELNSLRWVQSKKEAIINNNSSNNNNNNNNNNNYNDDKNNDNNNFQNILDDALNCETIEIHPERISKLKPYINKYDWKRIEFPAGSNKWQKCEQNNKTIALNYYI